MDLPFDIFLECISYLTRDDVHSLSNTSVGIKNIVSLSRERSRYDVVHVTGGTQQGYYSTKDRDIDIIRRFYLPNCTLVITRYPLCPSSYGLTDEVTPSVHDIIIAQLMCDNKIKSRVVSMYCMKEISDRKRS